MTFDPIVATRGLDSPYEPILQAETAGDWSFYLLTKAVICVESAWNPNAIRQEPQIGDASRGLMQLLYTTAQSLGYAGNPDGLFDPATNVHYGTAYLRYQLDRYPGSPSDAISAYNAGHAARLAGGGYANQSYVDAVTTYYVWYQNNQPAPGGGGQPAVPPPASAPSGTPSTAVATDPATGELTDAATGQPIDGATDALTGQAVDPTEATASNGTMVDAATGDPLILSYTDPATGQPVPILPPAAWGVAAALPFLAVGALALGLLVLLGSRRG